MKAQTEIYQLEIAPCRDPLKYSLDVKSQLDSKFKTLSSDIQTWKTNSKRSENELIDQFQSINSRLSSHVERKKMYQSQVNSLKNKINIITEDIENSKTLGNDIALMKKDLERDESELEDIRSSFKSTELENKLRALSAELQSKEFLLTEINEEISSLTKHADSRARLGIKLNDRDANLATVETLQAQLDSTWKRRDGTKKVKMEPSTIESEIRNELRLV